MEHENRNSLDYLVSVVICAYSLNRFDATINCIYSILNNTYKNYEIILVIDGNKELEIKMESIFKGISNITIIENTKNEGPSVARNLGIKTAKGDIIVFIDDDAFALSDWLEKIVKNFIEYPSIRVCGGKIIPIYEKGAKSLPDELLWIVGCTYNGHIDKKMYIRNVISANMAVRKEIFNDIQFEKMFDGKNWKMEDTLFCIRLFIKDKNSILYDPNIIVYHNVPKNRTEFKYIIQRSCSEGTLKYDLGHIIKKNFLDNQIFTHEQNYLKLLIYSIFRNVLSFRFKNCLFIFSFIMSVGFSYSMSAVRTNLDKIKGNKHE